MAWIIDFFPVKGIKTPEITISGKTITVDGEVYDFGFLGEADIYPAGAIPGAEKWLRSTEVTLWQGDMRCCVVTPQAPDDAPEDIRHPGSVTVASGRVPHPIEELTNGRA